MSTAKIPTIEGLTYHHFVPSFDWKPSESNPNKVVDNLTGKKYGKTNRSIGWLLWAPVCVIYLSVAITVAGVAAVALRIAKVVSFYPLWKAESGKRVDDLDAPPPSLKQRLKPWGKEMLRIAGFFPAWMAAELSLLILPVDPQNGFKLIDSWTHVLYKDVFDSWDLTKPDKT
jgi:hypothetical protein